MEKGHVIIADDVAFPVSEAKGLAWQGRSVTHSELDQ